METVIEKPIVLDLLDSTAPALSATSDMPVVETRPDSLAPIEEKTEAVPPEEDEGEAEQPEEAATSATEEPGQPAKHRGVGKKINELTKRIDEAERRADQERTEKLRLLAIVEGRNKPEVVKTDDEPVRPERVAYADDAQYLDAIAQYADEKAAWTARREIQKHTDEQQKRTQEDAIAEGQRKAREAYVGRIEKVREKYADFSEVAETPNVTVSMPMAHAIVHSEHGPEIQYYLGKNPDEAKRIASLDVPSQLVELGFIVGKLNAPAKTQISAAPRPLKSVKSSDTGSVKDPQEMSMDEYAQWRQAQRKAK